MLIGISMIIGCGKSDPTISVQQTSSSGFKSVFFCIGNPSVTPATILRYEIATLDNGDQIATCSSSLLGGTNSNTTFWKADAAIEQKSDCVVLADPSGKEGLWEFTATGETTAQANWSSLATTATFHLDFTHCSVK